MLEISHEEIIFLSKQMKKSLMLTNNSESSIIFKIKTNVLNLIVATPSKGYIEPKQTINIQIKCEKDQAFQVKLQVIYGLFLQMKNTIDATWNSLSKNQFKHKMVYLSKEQASSKIQEKSENHLREEKQNQSKQIFRVESVSMHSSMSQSVFQSQNNGKIEQSSLFQTKKQSLKMIQSITTPISQRSEKEQHKNFIKKTMEQEANRFEQEVLEQQLKRSKNTMISQNNNNNLGNNIHRSKGNNTKTLHSHTNHHQLEASHYNYMNHSQLVKLAMVQQQLLKQKQINQKLSKKLIKTNQLYKDRHQYQIQSKVNISMQACPQDHFGISTIIVICMVFFIVGFLIAKF